MTPTKFYILIGITLVSTDKSTKIRVTEISMLKVKIMMKKSFLLILLAHTLSAFAESSCDIRPGTSVGIKVIEFASGNQIHSKMPMSEGTAEAIIEEMVNLQEMGVCEEKIIAQKCILKFEKISKTNYITLYRGKSKWNTWHLKSKDYAQNLVKHLKRVGFCS